VAALLELAAAPAAGIAAADLAAHNGGAGVVAGLARRGLVGIEVRERARQPLATRPPGLRGTRPVGSTLSPAQADAVAVVAAAIAGRDPTPLLLDGLTGAGKTAVYAEAIRLVLSGGRAGLVLVPEIALALPLVDRLRAELDIRVAIVHAGLAAGERPGVLGSPWPAARDDSPGLRAEAGACGGQPSRGLVPA
jgi:primosomal protein N' (replication factor Y)